MAVSPFGVESKRKPKKLLADIHSLLVVHIMRRLALLPLLFTAFQLFGSSSALYRSKDVFSCFTLHSNEFLEKSGNVLIEKIEDVNECLRKCIQAPLYHKLRCKTVMYNVNTQNCVLSKYARSERVVKKSKGLQIDLYENLCAQPDNETVRLAVFTEQIRTTAAPLNGVANLILNVSFGNSPNAPTTTPPSAIVRTNELRRVHAVKQLSLDSKKENLIFSKTVYADPATYPEKVNRMKVSGKYYPNAKVFLSPRPLVDSTSAVVVTSDVPKERRQRSERENLAPCFLKTPGHVLVKFEESRTGGMTLETCMRQCAQMTRFYCASVNYSFNLKTCILNGGNLHLNGGETLLNSRDFDYYENTCQPRGTTTTESSMGISTKKECYRLYNNSIYNSFDATIVGGLADLESCESECSWSHVRRREKCLGVNWIPVTRGCMLFHKQIDYNILQPSLKAVFLANTCNYTTDDTSSTRSTSSSSSKSRDPDYYDSSA